MTTSAALSRQKNKKKNIKNRWRDIAEAVFYFDIVTEKQVTTNGSRRTKLNDLSIKRQVRRKAARFCTMDEALELDNKDSCSREYQLFHRGSTSVELLFYWFGFDQIRKSVGHSTCAKQQIGKPRYLPLFSGDQYCKPLAVTQVYPTMSNT